MPGLDATIIRLIDHQRTLGRIVYDCRSDFILAPHYFAIYKKASEELWSVSSQLLRSGNYQPDLPLTISIPKERGFSRPGSILNPIDRFVYQALIDLIATELENELDRNRTFSHVYINNENAMFKPAHECWKMFDDNVSRICDLGGFVLKADISNYFERIPHHPLVNLTRATNCNSSVINLLEEILSAFRERNSYGIIQGVFPSDLLGNFFLSDIDAYCEQNNIPSARYVDDIYMHYGTKLDAQRGLNNLIERLRKNGLHLNEYKSKIFLSTDLVREKTAIDKLFDEARNEVETTYIDYVIGGYVFLDNWELGEAHEEFIDQDQIELLATEKLYSSIDEYPDKEDEIEKFCIPLLHASGSDYAVERVLSHLISKPHLSRLYYPYLSRFVARNPDLVRNLERIISEDEFITDFERMFILGSLFNAQTVNNTTVNIALRWFENKGMSQETRAIAILFAAKHGTAVQKRAVRMGYDSEPSQYVKSALLYSSKFLPADKWACKRAWGSHNKINELISQII